MLSICDGESSCETAKPLLVAFIMNNHRNHIFNSYWFLVHPHCVNGEKQHVKEFNFRLLDYVHQTHQLPLLHVYLSNYESNYDSILIV